MSFIYKGLEATYKRHLVTEEEIDRHLERLQQQTPNIKVITDRPARNGDELVLDYAGFCDGEQFAGGTAEQQALTLGSGMFIPGFEEQLLGANVGDVVTVKVTFPQQYHAEALAGKDAEFRCTVHEIREKGVFTMGDEFAQSMGFYTFEELREQAAKSMQEYTDARGQMDLEDQLIRKAAETFDFQPSEEMVQAAVEEQVENLKAQLAHQGLTLDMYAQFTGQSEEQVREDFRAAAGQNLRIRAAVDQIVELEQIKATETDISNALAEISSQNNLTMEQLQEMYDDAFAEAVVRNVLMRKAMIFVRENAIITETHD